MTYAWSFSVVNQNTTLSDSAFSKYAVKSEAFILATIDASALAPLEGKVLNITLLAENFLGFNSTAWTLVEVSSSPVPTVRHKLGNFFHFRVFQPLDLQIYTEEKCDQSKAGYTYNWELVSYTGTRTIVLADVIKSTKDQNIMIPKNTFEVGS
jgi:hypothetical protein